MEAHTLDTRSAINEVDFQRSFTLSRRLGISSIEKPKEVDSSNEDSERTLISIFTDKKYDFISCRTEPTLQIMTPETKFNLLRELWYSQRNSYGSIQDMILCSAYQEIIALGGSVVPCIIKQLENEGEEPDCWFWALSIITNANPVPDEKRGMIYEMAKCWIEWAKSNGHFFPKY